MRMPQISTLTIGPSLPPHLRSPEGAVDVHPDIDVGVQKAPSLKGDAFVSGRVVVRSDRN